MINNIKHIAVLAAASFLLSCSGGRDSSSDVDTEASPGPVGEMDRSRYNLNEPDEMLHEMQDSVGIEPDSSVGATDSSKRNDSLID